MPRKHYTLWALLRTMPYVQLSICSIFCRRAKKHPKGRRVPAETINVLKKLLINASQGLCDLGLVTSLESVHGVYARDDSGERIYRPAFAFGARSLKTIQTESSGIICYRGYPVFTFSEKLPFGPGWQKSRTEILPRISAKRTNVTSLAVIQLVPFI